MKVKVNIGQTISDIALEQYGSMLGIAYLIADNEGILSREIEGEAFEIRDEVVNGRVKNYFANQKKRIVTT